jgi:hypothetical protein
MQINDKQTSWKRNNIHEALKAGTAHGKPSFRGAQSANPESRDSGSGPSDHPGMT